MNRHRSSLLLGILLVLASAFAFPCFAQELNWTQKFPPNSPPARFGHAMAYDEARGEVILFGGCSNSPFPNPYLDDTWAWNGSDWIKKLPASSPPARYGHVMAYDAVRREIVMIGGSGIDGNARNDTWVWNGDNWIQKAPARSPSFADAMAYDAARGEVVLIWGGTFIETWVWDGSNWIQKFPANFPPGRSLAYMAYDATRGEIVLFGGAQFFNDTWVWDGSNWVQKFPVISPTPRGEGSMVFDALSGQIMMFGGYWLDPFNPADTIVNFNDTWVWDGSAWLKKFPSSSPIARTSCRMAYDAARGQVVMFGGVSWGIGNLNDTWVWGRLSMGCTTSVQRLSQGGNSPWANDLYDHSDSATIRQLGCAMTSLSMALNFSGLANDPGWLNQFMIEHDTDYYGLNVNWDAATRDVSDGNIKFHFLRSSQYDDIRTILCLGFPVIVGVNLDSNGTPGHFVLVTGEQAGHFQIADPGYANRTTLDAYNNRFETRGYVADPPGDISSINIAIGGTAELLVQNSSGKRTGYGPTSNGRVEEIPKSVYIRDALEDDETGASPSQTLHLVHISQPEHGNYQVTINGIGLGIYKLSIRPFSSDGSSQPELSATGISGPGSSSTFSIDFDASPGTSSNLVRITTFASLLLDIQNALSLGLIDNRGIAKSLSSKLNAASVAAAIHNVRTAKKILRAFKNELAAQTSKHVNKLASKILMEGASSLMDQL